MKKHLKNGLWTVYILRNENNALYTGITTDLNRRLNEHKNKLGKGAKYTRSCKELELVYYCKIGERSPALKVEAKIKRLKKDKKEIIVKSALKKPDLYKFLTLSANKGNESMDIKQYTSELVEKIRNTSPLTHNITNFVVMNSSANILLAIGASPVMAHCLGEVEEMTSLADALVLNIGTLQDDWIESMILAAKTANTKGIPVILDPVGSGATSLRTQAVKKIMNAANISVLRGNASEIFSLASADVRTRGVDSSLSVTAEIIDAAQKLASEMNCIIAISGEKDIITDGRKIFQISNGQPLMTKVTGIGCGLSAVTGAFCAISNGELLAATAAAFGFYGLCGDLAIQVSDK
ncbi:MAG: hydroxyethylthiazole kinase, partial [Desulfobacteraceae bacterium]|nr:hydroxyethylthiazole kinase [Desulfobacteraceae bacterium]